MARQVKTSDILLDDNLDALIAKLKQLEGVVEGLTVAIGKEEKAAAELETTTKTLNATTANGRDTIVKNAKAAEEVERAHKAYTKTLAEENDKIQELKVATNLLTNLKKNEARAALSAEGSYNKLSAQYNIMKLALNAMSKAEREGTEAGRQLVKTANATYQEMKRLQEQTGKHVLSVGDYAKATHGLSQNLGEMKKDLMALRKLSFTGKSEEEVAQINKQIGILVDNMDDLRAQQKALGTEMSTLFVGSLKVVSAGVEGLVGTLSLLGVESEELRRLESNMLQLVAVTHALSEIEDALQKKTIQTTLARIGSSIATAKDTVVRAANVFTTNAAIRAENAKSVALARGSIVTRGIAAAQWAWNAALAANPIGLIVTAVLLLTTAVVAYAAAQKESNEQLRQEAANRKISNELSQQAAINAVDEKVKVGNLVGILKDENSTKKEKHKALKMLNEIAPEYFKGLTIEKDGVEAVAKAYTEKYLPALERRTKFEAATQRLIEIEKELLDTTTQMAETKPGFFTAAVSYVKNFGNSIEAAKDLANDWTAEIAENRKELENDKAAVLKFIQANDLATEALNDNTGATEKNTSAKKKAVGVNEQLAIQANRELGYQNELNDLLREELRLEQELNEKALDAQIKFTGDLEDATKLTTDNILTTTPAQLRAQAAKQNEVFSIYDLLGIKIDDRDEVKSSFDFAKAQLSDFLAFRTEIANRNVANRDREVAAAQHALDLEIENREQGLAHLVDSRAKDLADAKKRQQEALKEQERVAKAERAIQTIQQATNLITGISKLFAEKNILAIPLAALMLGSFVGFKLAALGAAKREFAEGDYQILQGGSHASGNDIPLGTHSSDGRPEYAEGGEARMILSKRSTRKYKNVLPHIFQTLKKGTFEMEFTRQANAARDLPLVMNVGASSNVNMGGVEKGIGKLIEQGRNVTLVDGKGRPKTIVRGNLTTVINYRD